MGQNALLISFKKAKGSIVITSSARVFFFLCVFFYFFLRARWLCQLLPSSRFVRVGSVVLALHDASDVFIETGKMSKYSGAETTASIAFILFVLCFTVTRIIYYPFWILRSTSYEVVHALKMDLDAVKQIQEKGKVSEDIRSDSEDEHEHKHEE
ncbi:hypothetical protein JHK86_003947 [Glycine max]|nr:hypothetical protein JHK86_003947 [Glycine max]